MNLRSVAFLFVLLLGSRAMALDPADCDAAAKKIDDRIAAGNHPQQNVAIATQMRDGIVQSCAFLDEAALVNMLQGVDQLLPGADGGSVVPQKSDAEREAEREAQRAEAAERRAEREKQRAAKQARKEAEQDLVSGVVRKPPAKRSVEGQLMDRPDEMWGVSIVDWDVYENRARLLYETWPSREQGRLEEAARHLYVVEFYRNDNIVQHHIVETKLGRTVTAGLIRGHDEVMLQWHESGADGSKPLSSTLERWSISNTEMLSSSPAPERQGPGRTLAADDHFQLLTADGDLLYAKTIAMGSGPTPKTGVSWMLASPDGEVHDQGLIVHDDEKVSSSNWFHAANGSAGLILDVTSVDEHGVASQLQPDTHRFGSTDVRPLVNSERRLYVVGGSETDANLPAFERQLMWLGLEKVDQSVMISGEPTRQMNEAEGKYRVRDSAVTLAVAGRNRVVVAPTDVGHAILIRNNHRDGAFPPTRGLWLQEFAGSKPRRDTYLNPDAEHLKTRFNMLASDGGDRLYVGSGKYVLLFDGARKLEAYAESSATAGTVKAMTADGDSVWLFGEHHGRALQQQVWVERIQF